MKNSTMIEIDGQRLKEILSKRGLTLAEVAREMGYATGFMNNVCSRNVINMTAAKMLNMIYHVPLDDYKKPEPPAEPESEFEQLTLNTEQKQVEPLIDYERLWKVIYTACYEAVKKVWTE